MIVHHDDPSGPPAVAARWVALCPRCGIIIGSLLAGVPVVSISAAAAELASPAPLVDLLFLRATPRLQIHGIDFRRRKLTLTLERGRELNIINRAVNREIAPKVSVRSAANEEWLI